MIGLLRHDLEVVGLVASGTLATDGEDRGHLATTETVLGTFRGLIQPKSARERVSVSGTDANLSTHRIYLEGAALALPVDSDMRIRKAGTVDADLNGDYLIDFVGNAAGYGHHIEIDATRLDP